MAKARNLSTLLAADGQVEDANIDGVSATKLTGTIPDARLSADAQVAKLPLAGGAMTGAITTNSTFDTRDVATDGTKLDTIETSATADQTKADIEGLGIDLPAANLTGTVAAARLSTATTQAESDDSTKIATTAYVVDKITTLIGGAPSTLNDLNELALAINDDASYNSTLTTALATKVPLAGGTMTGNTVHNDSVKSIYGTSSDGLEIHHTSGNSFIEDTGTGQLFIKASAIDFQNPAGTATLAQMVVGGAVNLHHNGSQKLATTSTGITVTGDIANTSGDMVLDVAGALVLDANDSGYVTLKDNGTAFGEFNKATNDFVISSKISNGDIIFKGKDGSSVITPMTIDMSAGGNVGIGTTSINSDAKFVVSNGGAQGFEVRADSNRIEHFHYNRTGSAYMPVRNNGLSFEWYLENVSKMTLDGNGNVGLGVVPSTWQSTRPAIQIGTKSAISSYNTDGRTLITTNDYVNSSGTHSYIEDGYAMKYEQFVGKHRFQVASSGSAGNAISFTTAMTIDTAGKVGIGIAAPTADLHIHNSADHTRLNIDCSNSSGDNWQFQSRNNGEFWLRNDDNSRNDIVVYPSSGDADFIGNITAKSYDASAMGVTKWYQPSNSGNPEFYIGSSDANRLGIQTVYDSGSQNLAYTHFFTHTANNSADAGRIIFSVDDGAEKLRIDDAGVDVTGTVTVTGTISATATATLLIINSAGTTVKTINGIG